MQLIHTVKDMQRSAEALRLAGRSIGFVPTMGALHAGHASLLATARGKARVVVASIFVNPTQFGPDEDYQAYPRSLDRDLRLIGEAGGDIVYIPGVEEVYPKGYATTVQVDGLTEGLCGAARPGHFKGVTTVVAKLFHAVKPHVAVLGQKDAQQALTIRQMVKDLNMDLEVIIAPTIREADGLAMSSRNAYLTAEERSQARTLFQALQVARGMVEYGERDPSPIIRKMEALIRERTDARIDYISIVETAGLTPLVRLCGEVLIALAVRFGKARLIDNIILTVGTPLDPSHPHILPCDVPPNPLY